MDASLIASLTDSVLKATAAITAALEAGNWDPTPRRDPLPFIETLEVGARQTPSVVELSKAQDLSEIALAAMSAGEWTDVTEADLKAIQGMNFLSQLASEMAATAIPACVPA